MKFSIIHITHTNEDDLEFYRADTDSYHSFHEYQLGPTDFEYDHDPVTEIVSKKEDYVLDNYLDRTLHVIIPSFVLRGNEKDHVSLSMIATEEFWNPTYDNTYSSTEEYENSKKIADILGKRLKSIPKDD